MRKFRIVGAFVVLACVVAGSLLAGSAVAQSDKDGVDVQAAVANIDAKAAKIMETGGAKVLAGPAKFKNVIVLVPDGCSQSVQTLARWYKGEPLTLDAMNVGAVEHYMASSVITDSAAASAAFGTGYKTTDGFMGVGPRPDDVLSTYEWPFPPEIFAYRPVASVLEGAKLIGKATGLVATCRFTHATPGAWACHSDDRDNENKEIAEHMVYNELDLVFGGGERNLIPNTQPGGKRVDGEDLVQVLLDRGYSIARTEAEMNALTNLPAYGMFAMSHMDAEINRPIFHPDEPSLAAMTAKAIELLSQDPQGFVMQVEGSQVDWAGHANDPIWMVTDFIEFDEAVKVAVDFAMQDGQTLVLAYPDHNTGGMDIGNRKTNGSYTGVTVEDLVDPLKGMTITAEALAAQIQAQPGGATVANIQAMALQWWNLDVDAAVAQEILDLTGVHEGDGGYTISFGYALARVISERYTVVGWTSHGHNAEDVPLWAYSPCADFPAAGVVDNTDLAKMVFDACGIDMNLLNNFLFVDLAEDFNTLTIDMTDPQNPVARLDGVWGTAELPCSKDLLTIETNWVTRTYNMPGLTVYAPATNRVYASKLAVLIMKLWGIY